MNLRASSVGASRQASAGPRRARRGSRRRARARRTAAMTTAVGASHRLPSAARLGVARRNSLRSLRELRSDNRRESEVRSALRAPTPRLRCSAPPTSPRCAWRALADGCRDAPDAAPLTPAALETSVPLGPKAATQAASNATVPAKARAMAPPRARPAGRVARRRRALAQPRSAGAPARARSALRPSFSRRLSERSSRSERSEFRRGAGAPSIAGNPREAGASNSTPAAGDPARWASPGWRHRPRLCTRQPSARRGPRNAPRSNRGEMSWH